MLKKITCNVPPSKPSAAPGVSIEIPLSLAFRLYFQSLCVPFLSGRVFVPLMDGTNVPTVERPPVGTPSRHLLQ